MRALFAMIWLAVLAALSGSNEVVRAIYLSAAFLCLAVQSIRP